MNPLAPAQPLAPPPTQADAFDANSKAYGDWVEKQRQSGVASGMLDPDTGWPTQAALLDAAHQYGSALIGSTSAPGMKGFTAYHGSPHNFDKFDLKAIGTGEGAQAYGHGLYFADQEGVARGYRDALSAQQTNPAWLTAKWAMDEAGNNIPAAVQKVQGSLAWLDKNGTASDAIRQKHADAVSLLNDGGFKGHMYEVNINADPAHFLDWDKPLSEQSPHVQQALGLKNNDAAEAALNERAKAMFQDARDRGIPFPQHPDYQTLATQKAALKNGAFADLGVGPSNTGGSAKDMTGGQFYQGLMPRGAEGGPAPDQTAAAARLHAAGIPGIRYLDGGSRADGSGTSNHVIFDPATIEILRKYGIAGVMGGGAAAVASGQNQPTQ